MTQDRWERPMTIVDIVLLTLVDDRLNVVLLKRDKAPHEGAPALVGGFVHVDEDEDLDMSVARILKHKTGLQDVFVEQLETFGSRLRDARGWSITVTYLALLPFERLSSLDRADLVIVPLETRPPLPFDHDTIVDRAIMRLRSKGSYSILPALLLPPSFTLADLQKVYEMVMDRKIDVGNFRRKMTDLAVEETGEISRGFGRPAALYRIKEGAFLFDRTI